MRAAESVGVRLTIDRDLAARAPGITLGVVRGTGLHSRPSDPRLDGLVNGLCRDLEKEFAVGDIAALPEIAATRQLLRAAGIDPTKHRPSNEALLRRVAQQRGLYRLDTIVDANNYCSLKFRLPFGTYDQARLEGDLVFRVGRPGEEYSGIGGVPTKAEGRPVLADAAKIVGGPILDSDATKITSIATDILSVCYGPPGVASAVVQSACEALAKLLTDINGGTTTVELVTAAP